MTKPWAPAFASDIERSKPRLFPDRRFTYREYRTWPDDERWEIVHGHAVDITEPPGLAHQTLLMDLSMALIRKLPPDDGHYLMGPFDVLLERADLPDDEVENIVQPDFLLSLHPEKFTDRYYRGVPDFLLEVVCPFRARHDLSEKLDLYEEQGVRECWLAHPGEGWLIQHVMQPDGRFRRGRFLSCRDTVTLAILPGIALDLATVFPAPEPRPTWWKTEIINGYPLSDPRSEDPEAG